MLVKHKLTGSVYYLDEFLDGVRIRNYRTGDVRSLPEENFKNYYELVEEDYPQIEDSGVSIIDDVIKELKLKSDQKKKKKVKIKEKPKKVVKKKEAPKKSKKVKIKRKLK